MKYEGDSTIKIDNTWNLPKAKKGDEICGWRCNWCAWNSPQRLEKKKLEELEQRKNRDHPYHSFIKIGENTRKIPEEQRRFAVTKTSVKNYLLKLVWKTRIEGK